VLGANAQASTTDIFGFRVQQFRSLPRFIGGRQMAGV
jgi:hypothetical protein